MANLNEAAERLKEARYGTLRKATPRIGITTGFKRNPKELKDYWLKENQRLNKDLGNSARLLGNIIAMPLTTSVIKGLGKFAVTNPALRKVVGKTINLKHIRWAKKVLREGARKKGFWTGARGRVEYATPGGEGPDITQWGFREMMKAAGKIGIKVPKLVKDSRGGNTSESVRIAANFIKNTSKDIIKYLGTALKKMPK